ncbi:glycerate kinase [Gordonia effusa NBRC 100432]|uniref:Glycerate kinase n=1 Tax=Gordonia effusa NBRC 100432 TaxID=1077974 RepID=H0R3J8_9ACTN|nr:glycerate kinase [Gordonia effusa]GAB19649.1 glycerate kinase [Gordonia effusa NBRC 100432]
MHALVAPDKFKGCLTAAEVGARLAHGARRAGATTTVLPLADGGDGSVDAAVAAGFAREIVTVASALGEQHDASIAVGPDTVVAELANTCGMATLPTGVLAPIDSSTVGLGQAVRAALRHRPRRLVLALGGSASTDGGIGMLTALGYTFSNVDGDELSPSAASLSAVDRVEIESPVLLNDVEIVIAGDVTNPLVGPNGAAHVFGPQKGADPAMVSRLDKSLADFVNTLVRNGFDNATEIARLPGAGAAGGAGFAAMLLGGQMVSGAEFFLDLLGFDDHVSRADVVLTGEGSVDTQTMAGKLLSVLTRRAACTPVVVVAGRNLLDHKDWTRAGFRQTYALDEWTDVDTASDPLLTGDLLEHIAEHAVRNLR